MEHKDQSVEYLGYMKTGVRKSVNGNDSMNYTLEVFLLWLFSIPNMEV